MEAFIDEARARRVDSEVASVVNTALDRLAEGKVNRVSEALRDRLKNPCETRRPGADDVSHFAVCHLYEGSNEVIVVEMNADTVVEADD